MNPYSIRLRFATDKTGPHVDDLAKRIRVGLWELCRTTHDIRGPIVLGDAETGEVTVELFVLAVGQGAAYVKAEVAARAAAGGWLGRCERVA